MEMVKKAGLGELLNFEETYKIFTQMMDGELSEAEIACVLIAMRLRGETPEEIAGAARAMNDKRLRFDAGKPVYDTCGTGGSGKSTMNVSSAVAITISALGFPVVKHGNRAISGSVGSADIYELAGVPVDSEKEEMEKYFKENDFAFLFAPKYHPALKYAGSVRKKLGVPTIFNFLGPLANPADVAGQIIGISRRDKLEDLAEAMLMLGRDNVAVYSSLDGYDEVSSTAPTQMYHIKSGTLTKRYINPTDFFSPFAMPVVKDGDEALKYFYESIEGEGNLQKLIALNAGVALEIFGGAEDVREGFEIAYKAIASGSVMEKYKSLRG